MPNCTPLVSGQYKMERYVAVYDYTGAAPDQQEEDDEPELSFKAGQTILVTDTDDADWYTGYLEDESEGKSGVFPANYVKKMESELAPEAAPAPEPEELAMLNDEDEEGEDVDDEQQMENDIAEDEEPPALKLLTDRLYTKYHVEVELHAVIALLNEVAPNGKWKGLSPEDSKAAAKKAAQLYGDRKAYEYAARKEFDAKDGVRALVSIGGAVVAFSFLIGFLASEPF